MYNINVNTAVKTSSKINWAKGEVRINHNNNIRIDSNSYTKREKVFWNGKWIDTIPKVINIKGSNIYYNLYFKTRSYINYFDTKIELYTKSFTDLAVFNLNWVKVELDWIIVSIYKNFILVVLDIVIYKQINRNLIKIHKDFIIVNLYLVVLPLIVLDLIKIRKDFILVNLTLVRSYKALIIFTKDTSFKYLVEYKTPKLDIVLIAKITNNNTLKLTI